MPFWWYRFFVFLQLEAFLFCLLLFFFFFFCSFFLINILSPCHIGCIDFLPLYRLLRLRSVCFCHYLYAFAPCLCASACVCVCVCVFVLTAIYVCLNMYFLI